MKQIEIVRFANFPDRTVGRLIFDGFNYYTIENPWLDNQINISCIPDGEYKMVRVDSPKYGHNMWKVSKVPGRTHILIHVANQAFDVTGCIGLGMGLYGNLAGVSRSRVAITEFYDRTKGIEEMDLVIHRGYI